MNVVRRGQTFDETTGRSTETITSLPVAAIQVRGSVSEYARLGLSEYQSPTFLLTSESYDLKAWNGEFSRPGDEIEWGGGTFVVRYVGPTAIDGFVICARVIAERGG